VLCRAIVVICDTLDYLVALQLDVKYLAKGCHSSARQPSKLAVEVVRINSMLEHLHSVDEDHRYVVTVSIAKRRIVIDVDFFQHELPLATGV